MFPVSKELLHSTGIPREFISYNTPSGPSRVSTYYCLYGECKVVAAQKALMMIHIRRKHLSVAIACKYCGKQWGQAAPTLPIWKRNTRNCLNLTGSPLLTQRRLLGRRWKRPKSQLKRSKVPQFQPPPLCKFHWFLSPLYLFLEISFISQSIKFIYLIPGSFTFQYSNSC